MGKVPVLGVTFSEEGGKRLIKLRRDSGKIYAILMDENLKTRHPALFHMVPIASTRAGWFDPEFKKYKKFRSKRDLNNYVKNLIISQFTKAFTKDKNPRRVLIEKLPMGYRVTVFLERELFNSMWEAYLREAKEGTYGDYSFFYYNDDTRLKERLRRTFLKYLWNFPDRMEVIAHRLVQRGMKRGEVAKRLERLASYLEDTNFHEKLPQEGWEELVYIAKDVAQSLRRLAKKIRRGASHKGP